MICFYRSPIFICLFCALIFLGACKSRNDESTGAVEARDALSTYRVADGFKMELIASEPLISDPVDMEIDEYGRMYVVEMHGYPLDKSGSGKIIQLSDTDGDGVMDKRTVFREGLVLPTGILRWKKGFLITDAPALLYLEDTDNDGVANILDTVLKGFALTNPQHNVNSPVYGIDNWIYLAHQGSVSTREYKDEFGDEGSRIVFHADTNAARLPQNGGGRTIRVRPDQKLLEMTASDCQFGHTFDAWGHRFSCNNSNQGYHEVIAARYFQRNPNIVISESIHNMSDHLNAAEVFPSTINPDRQLLTDVGVMTSACGVTAYLGDAFPAPYNENITFIAEPVSNLVHVDVLRDSGASFTASRLLQSKEFISSTDAWARPVNLYVGPDGALYMLDYYRKVIESPEWMSEEAIAAGGLYDGSEKGRIFRITPTPAGKAEWMNGLKLGDASVEELVNTLAHKNYWWRINAQRLLVDRNDDAAVEYLNKMARSGTQYGRLHALWALQAMNRLNEEHLLSALKDSSAGIRENAIQLSEVHLQEMPSLQNALLEMVDDPQPKVRFQLLLTLGFINNNRASAAMQRLLFNDINDKWVQLAALTAAASQTASLLNEVLNRYDDKQPAFGSMLKRLSAMAAASGDDKQIRNLISRAVTSGNEKRNTFILRGLTNAFNTGDNSSLTTNDQKAVASLFFNTNNNELRTSALELLISNGITDSTLLTGSLKKAVSLVHDTAAHFRKRSDAIKFLALGNPGDYIPLLKRLISPREETVIQLAALSVLRKVNNSSVHEFLIAQWNLLTPDVRDDAIAVLMRDSVGIRYLISALEKNAINTKEVSFPRSVQLMQNDNDDLRNRARVLFTKNERDRQKVNQRYQEALTLQGDSTRGKQVYVQNCAICHQVRGKSGVAIGPDLGTIHNWKKEDILANVLNPNLSIASGFDMWEVQLTNGESLQGIIAIETPSAITLRNNGQPDRTISRKEIETLKSLTTSAMPAGFENTINLQQMADLISFLRQQ